MPAPAEPTLHVSLERHPNAGGIYTEILQRASGKSHHDLGSAYEDSTLSRIKARIGEQRCHQPNSTAPARRGSVDRGEDNRARVLPRG